MLLRELDRQARTEGGAVYMLNGNHESLNVCGDFRYVTAGALQESLRFMGVPPERVPTLDVQQACSVRGRWAGAACGCLCWHVAACGGMWLRVVACGCVCSMTCKMRISAQQWQHDSHLDGWPCAPWGNMPAAARHPHLLPPRCPPGSL
jgi:hypothetical protein